ncbi:MAG: hypothetical protein NVSMB51_21270 [Solirubrobacteraceae bacterium]
MSAPVKTRDRLAHVARFAPSEIRHAVSEVEGFNAKVALLITRSVGTMACAYLFALIALISLPDAIKAGRPAIISWIAQTFLQLVLLSIIMVGQSVQSAASDARAEKEFADTETILDRLDINTAGGIRDVLDAIEALEPRSPGPAGH